MDEISLGLMINKTFKFQDDYISGIFLLESNYAEHLSSEHRYQRDKRFFCLNHPQKDEFNNILGEQGTHSLNKLILSYLDAAIDLNEFSINNLKKLDIENVDLKFLEKKSKIHDLKKGRIGLSCSDTNLVRYNLNNENIVDHFDTTDNSLAELVFAMNMDNIFKINNISSFNVNVTGSFKMDDYDRSIMKMLNNSEFGMLILQWLNLNDYQSIEFSAGIYKILEYIINDLDKNREKFNTTASEFLCLEKLIQIVNSREKKYFSGLLNDTVSLGIISRHGSSKTRKQNAVSTHVRKTASLSETHEQSISEIYLNLKSGKKFPSISQLNYLYNFWHYTTSLIVCTWFLTRNSNY